MPTSRRRVAGALALAVAIVVVPTALPEMIQAGDLPVWSADLAGAATAAAALLAALIVLAGAAAWAWPHLAQAGRHLVHMTPVRRDSTWWLLSTTVLVVVVLATVALGLNYAHAISVSLANGQTGWQANLYPLTIDGLILGSSLALLWQRVHPEHGGGQVVWARVGFLAGLGFSAYTNVVYALHTPASTDMPTQLIWNVWPTLAFLITHEVLLWFVRRAVEGRTTIDPTELAAAEERATAAEADAAAAHAEVETAHREMAERLATEQQTAAQHLDDVREQLHAEARGRDATIEQLQDELTQLRGADNERDVELQQLRHQLSEVEQANDGTDRSTEDYRLLRENITEHVRRRRAEGEQGSLTAEVTRLFQVSPRWVQQHIPDATARRSEYDQQALQLAAAG